MKNPTCLPLIFLSASLAFGPSSSAATDTGQPSELIRSLPEHEHCFAVYGVLALAFEDAERLQTGDSKAVFLSLKVMAAELELLESVAIEAGCAPLGAQFGRGANLLLKGLRSNDFSAFENWNQEFNDFKAEEIRAFQRELEKKGHADLSAGFEPAVERTAERVISSATATAKEK